MSLPEVYISHEGLVEALSSALSSIWVWTLFGLIVLDVILGVAKSIKYKVVDSNIAITGLMKHMSVVLLALLIATLTRASGYAFAVSFSIAMGIGFILAYTSSIIENADSLGWPVPTVITKYFNRIRIVYDDRVEEELIKYEQKLTQPDKTKTITVREERIQESGEDGESDDGV